MAIRCVVARRNGGQEGFGVIKPAVSLEKTSTLYVYDTCFRKGIMSASFAEKLLGLRQSCSYDVAKVKVLRLRCKYNTKEVRVRLHSVIASQYFILSF